MHSEELKRLANTAEEATQAENLAAARSAWNEAQRLLPPDTVQFRGIADRIQALDARLAESHAERSANRRWKTLAVVGPALAFLLTKGKFLFLGLANLTTFSSMLAFLGVYWTLFGWKFALGLVLSIYVHEMGHVSTIKRFGMAASSPMFIPGFGAFVMLQQRWIDTAQDARIGLAGPLWGMGAAIASWGVWLVTHEPIWAAIAATGAWLNLLNLLPIWNLDGGRGFRALTRGQRGAVLASMLLAWILSSEGMLGVLAIACGYRLFTKDFPERPDSGVLWLFVGLVISLALLSVKPTGSKAFATP